MDYYKMRSLAIQELAELLEKSTPKSKIYYILAVKYGLGPRAIDKLFNIILGGAT